MILKEFLICSLLAASLVCLQAHPTEDADKMLQDLDEEQNLLDAALVEGELEDVPSLEGERVRILQPARFRVRIRLGGRRGLGGRIFRSRAGRIFWQYLGAR
ncbi:hypothetical protein SprV_0802631300 [Sparganum proliferum]